MLGLPCRRDTWSHGPATGSAYPSAVSRRLQQRAIILNVADSDDAPIALMKPHPEPILIRQVRLSQISKIAATKIRCRLNAATVAQYAACMKRGDRFPPLTLFENGSRLVLSDGYHRLAAAQRIGRKTILAEVRIGGTAEALEFAISANCTQGLQLTLSDKRRAAELSVRKLNHLSSNRIAKLCGLATGTVEKIRKRLVAKRPGLATVKREGADGKLHTVAVQQAGKTPVPPKVNQGSPSGQRAIMADLRERYNELDRSIDDYVGSGSPVPVDLVLAAERLYHKVQKLCPGHPVQPGAHRRRVALGPARVAKRPAGRSRR